MDVRAAGDRIRGKLRALGGRSGVQQLNRIAHREPAALDDFGVHAEVHMAEMGDQLRHRVHVAPGGVGVHLGGGATDGALHHP